jgi:hypothetical protein
LQPSGRWISSTTNSPAADASNELLNESLFFGLGHVRSAISEWIDDLQHISAALVARIPNPGSQLAHRKPPRL